MTGWASAPARARSLPERITRSSCQVYSKKLEMSTTFPSRDFGEKSEAVPMGDKL